MARQRRGSVSAEVPYIHRESLCHYQPHSQQKRRGVSAGVCARLCTFAAGLVCIARTPAEVVGLGQFIRVLHDIHESSIAGGEGARETARHS